MATPSTGIERTAMILAAGRGERMRPLSDATPKPLLMAGGKPLIVWQIEALAAAGFHDLVINVAHGADAMIAALRDGARFGTRIRYSREPEPLETAGGIATASPLLPTGPTLIVSGDIFTDFDYRSLAPVVEAMSARGSPPRVHLVMVDNPPYHSEGDFALEGDRLELDGATKLTFGNVGVYDMALFRALPRGVKLRMLPLYREWIAAGLVSGERFAGRWANVGTPADLAALDASLRAAAWSARRAISAGSN
jgi:MurNAc alpha-1-phosphate uridylyltransferase